MIWKGLVSFIIYLLTSWILIGPLYANQLRSGANNADPEELTKQKLHSSSVLQQDVTPFQYVMVNRTKYHDNQLLDHKELKDICCIPQESFMGIYSLSFILNDGLYDDLNDSDEWSVLSNLEDEDGLGNGVQNEIDLSGVEDTTVSNESNSVFDNASANPGNNLDKAAVVYQVKDIPVYTNKKINAFIKLYTKTKRKQFIKAIQRMPKYQEMIADTLIEYELPLNLAYLAIVESNLNPNARSRANAIGLWQFMSYTGKHFGLSRSWWHDDRYDPEKSTVAAAQYLKQLHRQFKGDWELALAAYNSGSGTVRRAIRRAKRKGKSTDYWSLKLPRETRGYVPAFYAVSIIFSNLEKYGFKKPQPVPASNPKQYISVGGGIAISQLAELFGVKPKVLSEFNPRLRFRGLTPPTLESFEVAIPASVSVSEEHIAQLEELEKNRHETWKIHRVKQGETLWSISRIYRVPLNKILTYNRLKRKNLLRIGQKLMLPVPIDWNPPKTLSKTKLAVLDMNKIPGVTKIHVVRKGETLWQISQRYNISIRKIKYWNRRVLRRRYLKIGTEIVLKIPVTVASNSI